MGFSVSGSAAIIFAGMLIAFSMFHTAGADSFERVTEAQSDRSDAALDAKNTDIVIDSATDSGDIVIDVRNTGSTTLSLNGTDVLVDNEYRTDWQADATVGGVDNSDLWLPGETATITVSGSGTPTRVKVVTEKGVSDSSEVS